MADDRLPDANRLARLANHLAETFPSARFHILCIDVDGGSARIATSTSNQLDMVRDDFQRTADMLTPENVQVQNVEVPDA